MVSAFSTLIRSERPARAAAILTFRPKGEGGEERRISMARLWSLPLFMSDVARWSNQRHRPRSGPIEPLLLKTNQSKWRPEQLARACGAGRRFRCQRRALAPCGDLVARLL